MVRTVGPATGSKAQMAFKEEGKWGYPTSPPEKFIEFTSESVVSEYTNLISAALRADRAVHKQRLGTESAGGDINVEIVPEGLGTLFKHALGRRLTKRKDVGFVLVYSGSDTDRVVTLSSTTISSTGTTGGDDFSESITAGMTLQQLITALHDGTTWHCYAPWGNGSNGYFAQAITSKTSSTSTLGASDYDSSVLARTAGGTTNMETFTNIAIGADGTGHLIFLPVNMKWGIYEHTIDAYKNLPEGLTFEVGRDVAAFNYYGSKVNSMTLTLNPGEIGTATFNVACKGASTVGDPAVDGTNTGWEAPVVSLRYAGSEASANIEVDDSTRQRFYFDAGTAAAENQIYDFSLERGYYSHDGYYFHVSRTNGLIEFLEYESSYFDVKRKAGFNPAKDSIDIKDHNKAALSKTADTTLYHSSDTTITPLFRGNYIGTDTGDSKTFYVDISTGGACDGATAVFKGSDDGTNWSSGTYITYGEWHDILDEDDADTGFDVMIPENVTLTQNDTWSFTTFKDENSDASYSTTDPFTGFQGAVTLDKGYGDGAASQGVMSFSATFNNNLYLDKYELGDRQRAAIIAQRRTVEATPNVEFDDLDLYRMFVNGAAGDLTVTLTSDEYINSSSTKYTLVIRMPNIKFTGSTPPVGGEEIIMHDMPCTALYDDTNSIPEMRLTLTNNEAYV